MPANFNRCSNRACHITGYDVIVSEAPEVGLVQFQLVDDCNTLHDAVRVKYILVRALKDWLAFNDASDAICASCLYPTGGPGMTFIHATSTLLFETSVAAPVVPVVVNVPLPLPENVNLFADVATTTTPAPGTTTTPSE
jgi:hypothetical protein